MNIWLAYVNYPITTAVYLKRALLQAGHQVTSIGPPLPVEAIPMWGLENMKLPLAPQDIDTSFTPDMAAIWDATPVHERPDLYLWVESINSYCPQNLDALTCTKACYLIDTHYHLKAALEVATPFEYVFIAQLIDLDAFRAIKPQTYWLPLACDPEIHGRQEVQKKHDIGFVGGINNRRTEMLDYLAEHFTVHRERAFWTDMARIFSESRIVLNDASFDDLNMRYFEALASGSMLLSNMAKGSGQDLLFVEGREYACHHDEDLIEVAKGYLINDKLREQVAAEGRKLVLAAHTYLHRVIDLIDVVTGKKQDTFSPEELRSRSISQTAGDSRCKNVSLPQIRSIITTRYRSNWPTWQMVHEWEDILATILAVPFRSVGESCMIPDPDCLDHNFDLIFLQLASELRYYSANCQLIPIVMDLWRDDFDDFLQRASQFKLFFVTNLQAYQELSPVLPNLRYLPFSLADQYFEQPLPEKDIDVIQYGRRNPLLEQYMSRLLGEYPETHYITTEAFDNEKLVRIYSNKQGDLGVSESRTTFMNLLKRCKISLVSTVGMDGSRDTGGIDPVSPRFLESMAAGCHLVGRIPANDEFVQSGVYGLCYHIDSYQGFKQTILALLANNRTVASCYQGILQERLTSALPARILQELSTLTGARSAAPTPEELMQKSRPHLDLENRLLALRQTSDTIPPETEFAIYQTLCDVIACYREFYQLDLSRYYSSIIGQQTRPEAVLLFTAMELASTGEINAARMVARRAVQINPADIQATILHADLIRKSGAISEARMACLEIQKQWPGHDAAQAVLDMCDIDEAFPATEEHYHLLHLAHRMLKPRRYLEIGVSNGKSLALVPSGTSAIGVDPATGSPDLLWFHSPDAAPDLFKLTSDDFFQQGYMERTWGDTPFDMAFIDGLHLFEQVLMDFINLERRSSPDSIIFIHDCLPVSAAGAERDRTTWVWTGDVWKVVACLTAVRPDLEIITFPIKPSGLAMVRKLDATSKLLSNQFDSLVKHFMEAHLPESMDERFKLLQVTKEPPETVFSDVIKQQGTFRA